MGNISHSLVHKLADACNKVGGVEKKGRNEHQKYAYVKAADVAKAIRRELFQRGIILTADEKEITQVDVPTVSGGTMHHLTLKVEFTLRDGKNGETLTMTAYGIAMDSGDKAIYKAKTGALKYFLRGLGIIPDEKDDPEFDESVDEQTDARIMEAHEKKVRNQNKEKVAEYQVRAFDAACHNSGKTAEQVAEFLRSKYNIATVADMQRKEFNDAIRWAARSEEDYAATLTTSVQAINRKKSERVMVPDPEHTSQAGD